MRIISGKHKGRKFYPPNNLPTRPTTDFAKEGLFNVLENNFDLAEVSFLDLFMGTGSISYEFASRGCKYLVGVDQFLGCVKFVKGMIEKLSIEGMTVYQSDVVKFLDHKLSSFDIIFAGPPYAYEAIDMLPEIILSKGILNHDGWLILETSFKHAFETNPYLLQKRKYGDTIFHIFKGSKLK